MFISYGLCEPSALCLVEIRPPCARVCCTSASMSACGRMPRAGLSPMPSCEARKLKKVTSADGSVSESAHSRRAVALPVRSVCSVSGGSAKL